MKPKSIPFRSYSFAAATVWFILLVSSLIWNVKNESSGAVASARIAAVTAFEKDVAYRRWNAQNGGVYALVTDTTRPNPYLDAPERDITTPSGKKLTMMNPAYMFRQVHELGKDALGFKGHLTSLNPIRPENAPDSWEAQALRTFETGVDEFISIEDKQGESYLRFMRPLFTEKACLLCHAAQGYNVGDVRGGISASVPMAPFNAISRKHITALMVVHGCLLLLGIAGIGFTGFRLHGKTAIQIEIQNELLKSEEKYRILFEKANIAIFVAQDGMAKSPNPKALDLFGYSEEDFTTKFFRDLVHPDDQKMVQDSHERRLKGEELPDTYSYRIINKAGDTKWVEQNDVPISWEGSPASLCFMTDITESKQAEDELTRIFELSPDLICIADVNEGYFKRVNPAWEIFGHPLEEFTSKPFNAFIHPDDQDATVQEIKRQLSGKSTDKFVNRYRCKDGSYKTLEWHATEAQADGIVYAIARDITEHIRIQEQLHQAQKMEAIGTLAGGIAHDFNNILGIIMGCTELSLHDMPKEAPTHGHLTEALKATNRAKDLVKQILAFSRQGGQDKQPLAIGIIIKEALKMLRSSLPTTIEIKQSIPKDSGLVMADTTQIHQIIMNLATNASHAMGESGGVLNVSVVDFEVDDQSAEQNPDLKSDSYVKLTVSDTGHGMEPEVMERVFDPYYTTKEIGQGTGLGLSVVHGIVLSHEGVINVHSEPGKGTTFEILFPKIDLAEDRTEIRGKEDSPTGTERILFVDDEPAMTQIYQSMLERLEYTVSIRTSSIEALEAFKAQPDKYDLIITDQTMPHLTGQMLAKEIMAIRPDIPIILCTGHSELINEDKAKEMGIRAFVMKPIAMGEIAKAIRKVLDDC